MLGIVLCDDDKFILELATQRIKKIIEKNKYQAEIICICIDSKELFNFLNNNKGIYLYFIDLDFGVGKLNGIDIAKAIKIKEANSKIVFVTNHHEMALKVLKSGVEPFGFLEKTTDMAQLSLGYQKYIQMALQMIQPKQEKQKEIELSLGFHETVRLQTAAIIYVEAAKQLSHSIIYHTVDGSNITVRGSIEKALEELGSDFIKSHRSIIVNKKHLVALGNGTVKLSNGEEVLCSFRLKNEVKKWI